MKLIDKILYIEFVEAVEAGMTETLLWNAKSKGRKCWTFINDPDDGRRVLIAYDEMRPKYKLMVQDWLKRKVINGERNNDLVFETYMMLREGKDSLINAAKEEFNELKQEWDEIN